MFKTAGKEKPTLKCPELEDDEFEALRAELQQFKAALKQANNELAPVKAQLKALGTPLDELNAHVVELYDWDAPGSSERAVRMETATAAGQALAGTAVAALKEFAEYLDKRNVDLGRLRTQIAERDKALNSYDEARAQLDKLRKKPPKDQSKMVAAEQKEAQARSEYESVHAIIDGELRELHATMYGNFRVRFQEYCNAQVAFFSGMRNAWQLLFQEDYPDTVAVATPAAILEKRRAWRDKSDKKAGKAEAKALKARLADEKKRIKAAKKAHKNGQPIGPPKACELCKKRKVKASVLVDGERLYLCKACTLEQTNQGNSDVQAVATEDDSGKSKSKSKSTSAVAASAAAAAAADGDVPAPSGAAPPPPPKKKKKAPMPLPSDAQDAPPDFDDPFLEPPPGFDEPFVEAKGADLESDSEVSFVEEEEEEEEEDDDDDVDDDEEDEQDSEGGEEPAVLARPTQIVTDDPFSEDPFAAPKPMKPTRPIGLAPPPKLATPPKLSATSKQVEDNNDDDDDDDDDDNYSAEELAGMSARAAKHLGIAVKSLEIGAFAESAKAAEEATLCAAPVVQAMPDEAARRGELRLCVAYNLAARVLCALGLDRSTVDELSAADKEPALRATRARFLADVPLKVQHRTACIRAALKVNADMQNWGVSADLIKMLLAVSPPDAAKLQTQGRYCVQQGLSNAHFTPYSLVCFKTLVPIGGQPTRCALCGALFAPAAVAGRTKCPLCKLGSIGQSE